MRKKQFLEEVLEEAQLPSDQSYYDRLHDRIMARIKDTEVMPPLIPVARSLEKSERLRREAWLGRTLGKET